MKNTKTVNETRYMEGVFTPLDSEEIQSACRKLWDELDKRNAALVEALEGLNQDSDPRCGFCCCPWKDGTQKDEQHSTACQHARAALSLAKATTIAPYETENRNRTGI